MISKCNLGTGSKNAKCAAHFDPTRLSEWTEMTDLFACALAGQCSGPAYDDFIVGISYVDQFYKELGLLDGSKATVFAYRAHSFDSLALKSVKHLGKARGDMTTGTGVSTLQICTKDSTINPMAYYMMKGTYHHDSDIPQVIDGYSKGAYTPSDPVDASDIKICRSSAPKEGLTVEKEACNSFKTYFMDYYPEAILFPNLKGSDCPTSMSENDYKHCRYKPARNHLSGAARGNSYVGQPGSHGDRISLLGGDNGRTINAKIIGGDIGDWDHTASIFQKAYRGDPSMEIGGCTHFDSEVDCPGTVPHKGRCKSEFFSNNAWCGKSGIWGVWCNTNNADASEPLVDPQVPEFMFV